ncbi:phosphoglycerate dehydrogenase-like enzyme [Croceifilum oryzae]|uniref:Phosphoglycerate dehydrogenase-like enzyme n=1 Tax=Croceifilum oryzae TaxID=1553429 RepID=A0AAJ1TP08_9BACL|nr:D-2-hydroxyacid dehydrogenase [Croceifilum oryzae]MDQ0417961.1 phosphoglycerate dehydrogenase-like enzyme [Croceifilum oryzae]
MILLIISSIAHIDEHLQNKLRNDFPENQFLFFSHPKEIESDVDALERTEILIAYGDGVSPEVLDVMPNLKWVHVLSSGLNLLPKAKLKSKETIVTNVKGIHAIPMSEYTISMILNIVRRNYHFFQLQQKNEWESWVTVEEAYGKTLGIIGLGTVGMDIAKKAKVFGMNIMGMCNQSQPVCEYVDEVVPKENMEYLLRNSDFVLLTVPLTSDTFHLIDINELNMMKKSAYIMNISRGNVINEEALIQVLKEKRIAGAVLDVFSSEPLPSDHPIWELDNVMVTPHAAGRTPFYMERSLDIFTTNLEIYPNESKMVNVIDLDKGY